MSRLGFLHADKADGTIVLARGAIDYSEPQHVSTEEALNAAAIAFTLGALNP